MVIEIIVSMFYTLWEVLDLSEEFQILFLPVLLLFGSVLALVLMGERQRREAEGTRLRLWLVALAATGMVMIPLLMGIVVDGLFPPENFSIPVSGWALCLSIISWFNFCLYFQGPSGTRRSECALPLVDASRDLNRVSEMSAAMKIRPPKVRLCSSPTVGQEALAWAGGLPHPSVVLSDGILFRLEPAERDAIVAHELAHIANGSLWVYAAFTTLASMVAVLALASGVKTWIFLGVAAYVGLWRILSRRIEYNCDLIGAKVAGFPEMSAALSAIHKIGGHERMTIIKRLYFATESHPALVDRLAHLRQHAPDSDRSKIPLNLTNDVTQTRLPWLCFAVWLAAIITGWRMGQIPRTDTVIASIVLLMGISLAPWIIRRVHWRLLGSPLLPTGFMVAGINYIALMLAGLLLLEIVRGFAPSGAPSNWHFAILLPAIYFLNRSLNKTGLQEFDQAWNNGDFNKVLLISGRQPRWLRKDSPRRYLAAMAMGIVGRLQESLADFEQLDRENRLGEGRLIGFASIQIECDRLESAFDTAERIKSEFPSDALGDAIRSRIFRKLGRLHEARQAAAMALEIKPEYGAMWASAAGIEIELGEFDKARQFLNRAHELDPGTPQELAELARLAVKTEPRAVAIERLERAIAAYDSNPRMLRPSEPIALRACLVQLKGESDLSKNGKVATLIPPESFDADHIERSRNSH